MANLLPDAASILGRIREIREDVDKTRDPIASWAEPLWDSIRVVFGSAPRFPGFEHGPQGIGRLAAQLQGNEGTSSKFLNEMRRAIDLANDWVCSRVAPETVFIEGIIGCTYRIREDPRILVSSTGFRADGLNVHQINRLSQELDLAPHLVFRLQNQKENRLFVFGPETKHQFVEWELCGFPKSDHPINPAKVERTIALLTEWQQRAEGGVKDDSGVSLFAVAFAIEEDDEAAKASVKHWIDSKRITAQPIGKCPLDGRRKLYRLSEILSDVKKILSLSAHEVERYRQALLAKVRSPYR